jgi:hypothetical protein
MNISVLWDVTLYSAVARYEHFKSNILLEAASFPIWVYCQMPSTNNFTNVLPCYP